MTEKIHQIADEKPTEPESLRKHTHEHYEISNGNTQSPEREEQTTAEVLNEAKDLAHEADKEKIANERPASPAEKRRGAPSKKQRENAFTTSMSDVRKEMNLTDRFVSSIIHNTVVEKTSDILGATIARPNTMLSGSVAAFVCVTLFYFLAKNYGYQLSGLETIAAFTTGWIVGILYDFLRTTIRRND